MAGTTLGRGEARRLAILEAAKIVVSRDGAGALTHRAVAAEGAVSLASTTYHFAGIDELRRMTFESAADEVGAGFESALAEAQSSTHPLSVVSERWAQVIVEHRAAFITVLEMLVAATRDADLRKLADELLARPAHLLDAAGFEHPAELVAELIGLALVHLVEPGADAAEFSRKALDAMCRHVAKDAVSGPAHGTE